MATTEAVSPGRYVGGRTVTALDHFPDHAERIGRIIATWTTVEMSLIVHLAIVTQTDRQIIIPMLYAIQSSRARLKVISAALSQIIPVGDPQHDGVIEILDRAGKILSIRDKYAHALYGSSHDGKRHYLSVLSMDKSRNDHEVALHELDHELKRAADLSRDVSKLFAARMSGQMPPQASPQRL